MRNYEFVTGIVGKFTEGMLHHQEISMVDNILLRTLGHYGNILDAYEKDLRSPFVSSPVFRANQKYNFYNFIGTSSKGVLYPSA